MSKNKIKTLITVIAILLVIALVAGMIAQAVVHSKKSTNPDTSIEADNNADNSGQPDETPDENSAADEPEQPVTKNYSLLNGGFENGLTGWMLVGDIGTVTSDNCYWNNDECAYGKVGNKLFSWWSFDTEADSEINREGNTGALISSVFTLKPNAKIAFRLGGGCDNNDIYIEFVRASDNVPLAKYFNTQANDGRLISYYAQLGNVTEETDCYIRIIDNATEGWGCFTLDEVLVNITAVPEGAIQAVNQLSNGGNVNG